MSALRVLIVGGGAVGQVYARCLLQGGAEVSWYLRPKYRAEAERGFTMYDLRGKTPEAPLRLPGLPVFDSPAQLAGRSFDLILLAISSTGLAGSWLPDVLRNQPGTAVLVLQPGLHDAERVQDAAGDDRIILRGSITLISYHAPLPGESRFAAPGMAFYLPPLGAAPVAPYQPHRGASLARELAATLTGGGLRTKARDAMPPGLAFGPAVLATLMAALEVRGWRFVGLAPVEDRKATAAAIQQAVSAVGTLVSRRPPLPLRLLGAGAIGMLLKLAPKVMPFDIETYFAVHFSKVRAQTLEHLRTFAQAAPGSARELHQLVDQLAEVERVASEREPVRA